MLLRLTRDLKIGGIVARNESRLCCIAAKHRVSVTTANSSNFADEALAPN